MGVSVAKVVRGLGGLVLTVVVGACAMEPAVEGGAAADREVGVVAAAVHAWGNYHWARTENPFTITLGDAVNSTWDPYLATTASDWSNVPAYESAIEDVLDAVIVPVTGKPTCKARSGQVVVCNAKYGNNGWLGLAQIWANGDHIVQALTKMNDTYFNQQKYNRPEWRNMVMCQEVGHAFGLDHQDEDHDNANLGSCMDYTSDPSTNQHPNQHDYEQMALIYEHLDDTTTLSPAAVASSGTSPPAAAAWGELVASSGGGHQETYLEDLGGGDVVVTHVLWAD